MSMGKLQANCGANISSMFLSEIVLWSSSWILSGLILATFWAIYWIRKWVEAVRRRPRKLSKAQRYPEEPSWAARDLSWGASGGPCRFFWAEWCSKRVAKRSQYPKGVEKEDPQQNMENVVSVQYLLCFSHVGQGQEITFWVYFGVLKQGQDAGPLKDPSVASPWRLW